MGIVEPGIYRKSDRFRDDVDRISNRIFDDIVSVECSAPAPVSKKKRVRTRLLSISDFLRNGRSLTSGTPKTDIRLPPETESCRRPWGWLVVEDGAGQGESFVMTEDVVRIGRAPDQDVSLDFGDDFISRDSHASLHFCADSQTVHVRDGAKANPVFVNNAVLSGSRRLGCRDRITIGGTTLRFVANAH